MKLVNEKGQETTVVVVRETAKALLVSGNCSEAWFPKAAITADGTIAKWFLPRMELKHTFLWIAPARRTTRFERRQSEYLLRYQELRGRLM